MQQQPIVAELKGITKRFPGIVANDNISFQLRKGEIHALLGENGAGKSTLMNILFGLYQPDEGHIEINGQPVVIDGAGKAIELRIGMVHQHFKLVKPFTVAENIILGNEPVKGISVDIKSANDRVRKLSDQYGLKVDPRVRVENITVGMQQRVEILKTLYRGADILIFDEPSAVLTVQEIDELLDILRALAREGKSIIIITHKLKEIMAIADTCTVIRRGKVVGSVAVKESSERQLAEMMVGRSVNFQVVKDKSKPGKPVLEVNGLTVQGEHGKAVVDEVTFQIRGGEIFGIAGVDGNGQTQLVEAITGMRKASGGSVKVLGKELLNASVRNITEAGVSHIPEDRHKHGLVLDFSVSENMVLNNYYKEPYSRNGILSYKAMDVNATKLAEEFDVRMSSIHTAARSLSGGNQQKAIIARELKRDPELIIAVQPTRGLDVGAIEFVHKQLIAARNAGKAVLLVSFELEELYGLSDRLAVIYEGRIMGQMEADEKNEEQIGLMMAGNVMGDAQRHTV
ncbi:ABC transporter ATP-binding protein [Paenibacillus pasadenensis]|uniref:ABC transporter ATP-binding protein n=1 Tax=Paenibacillus pasadenensis TaxID=217090 RepID=UPI00203E17D1|nr:ABC transporter ATP-binding protein [Paenibacillus pasadenensis]MCM3750084.1 ABC transporter ATP-binding protein [Paenibacillus pasadenensis]